MRSVLMVGLAVIASSLANAQPPSPDANSPMSFFVGSWTGSRVGADGSPKISRTYELVANQRQLQILERGNGRFGVWGVISIDPERPRFVLRQFPSSGHTHVLVLAPSPSSDDRLVFESTERDAGRVRITYERPNRDEFVERVERTRPDGGFEPVSEAHFKRRL